jgi:hypothetical protein
VAYRNGGGQRTLDNRGGAREGCPVADTSLPANLPPKSPVKRGSERAKSRAFEKRLEWQQVNSVTWRLVDPDGPQIRVQASHGQWGGYDTPTAAAWVFDVGVNGKHDWRVRVRRRGKWIALGSIIDADTAKRLAQQAVENPTEPRASKFGAPLNLLGGERRTAYAPELDSPTREYVRDVEIGAVLQKAPNEQPQASGDDESINVSAADDDVARAMAEEREWLDWPPADDGGDD